MTLAPRVTHARPAAPRGGVRSWWGKAWQRAVEEASYDERDLAAGRALARRGEVGGIGVAAGSMVAAVRDGDDTWTVQVGLPVLDPAARSALVDAVAAGAGRVAALLAGELPHDLVEHAEEAGAELLPDGGELETGCTCPHPLDPCAHALAVLVQCGWLVEADPLVLFALRGLDRETLLAEVSRGTPESVDRLADDVEVAADAVARARRLVDLLESGADVPDDLV